MDALFHVNEVRIKPRWIQEGHREGEASIHLVHY